MNFRSALFIILLTLRPALLWAQAENDAIVEVIVESVAENASEDFDYSELVERLNYYRKNPINLNRTGSQSLQELMFLSPLQVNQIISYRTENGKFLELYELQAIDALDMETIRKLVPFVSITETNPFKDLSLKSLAENGNNDVMFTFGQVLQKQEGYRKPEDETQSHYLGTSQRILTRYRYHYGRHLSASLTMEKDAGENFFSGKQSLGFDFLSASIFFKNDGKIKKIAVGDYSLQFGQGLSLWSGLSFGKGAAITSVAKNEIGLKPYTSTNEAQFFRGLASTFQIKNIEITPFLSYRPVDAGISQNGESGDDEIKSLDQSGLHRTAAEVAKRNSINQLVYGANVQYVGRSLRLGTVTYQSNFSKAFESGKQPYNIHDFADNKLTNLGLYYNYNWRNIYLFGEAAHSVGSGAAFLNGALASLTPQLALVLFHRDYQKDYHSFFNQALAEGSNAVNEKGFYSGIVITPDRKYEFSAYIDVFRFPWMRFRADAPSKGYELLSQFSYSPTKRWKALLRYKFENKEENDALDNAINFLEPLRKENYRFELSYKINEHFQVRNRAEVAVYQKGSAKKEHGFLLFQDLSYNPKSKISGNLRFALFETKSFNARIYAFENDVLYSFSAPAYQNKGLRFYLNGRYRMNRNTDIWFRYAITSYSDLEEIGSGLDRISGNNKSDFKLQLRLQF